MRLISFVQVNHLVWNVFMVSGDRLLKIGTAYKGDETAYFRSTSGNGRMFPSLAKLEQRLERAAACMWANRMERQGRAASA